MKNLQVMRDTKMPVQFEALVYWSINCFNLKKRCLGWASERKLYPQWSVLIVHAFGEAGDKPGRSIILLIDEVTLLGV